MVKIFLLIHNTGNWIARIYSKFEKYLKDISNKAKNNWKDLYVEGYLNLR